MTDQRGTCALTKFAPLGVESSVRSIVGIVLALMTLQMSSTRAIELERTAIFLEFCTGTRIADKIVLTAYHCLENRIPKWASGGGAKIKVVDHLLSPLARETKIDVAHDVALLYLEKSLPEDVPIVRLASRGQQFEKYVRLGYGFRAGQDGWIHGDALGILKSDEVVFWDKNSGEKGKLKFAQPANRTCPGDSGGPTLGLNDGDWYVVGVTSRVMPDMRHRFSWIVPLIRGKELPDFARYCGEYYTSERVTENLEFLVNGVQTLIARHLQVGSSLPNKASSRRRK
jgi:Trypsin